jgi:hypothetical protein
MHDSQRPAPSEYAAQNARYVERVPDGSVLRTLESGVRETVALLAPLPEAKAMHRYAPGKWSVKEVVGHLADSERVMGYRALRFARGDGTRLPGFDENLFAAAAPFDARPLAEVIAEFESVRAATLSLFRGFDEAAWGRAGVANETPVTVRALAWMLAGHELHHRALLVERYGI